jgi:hypothetical protein
MKLKPGQQLVSMAVLNQQVTPAAEEEEEAGAAAEPDDEAVADVKGPWLLFITTNGKGAGARGDVPGVGGVGWGG